MSRQLDIRAKLAVAVLCGLAGTVLDGAPGLYVPAVAALPMLAVLRQWRILLVLALTMPVLHSGFLGLCALAIWPGLAPSLAIGANLNAYVFYFLVKLAPLMAVFIATCRTSRLGELMAALTMARLPRPAVLAMAVSFRFVPTLVEEYGHIKDALRLRDHRSIVAQGIGRRTERLLLPLLMRAARLADELCASALTRGIEAPEARPERLRAPGATDAVVLGLALAVVCAAFVAEWTA